jgi:hypothetical protein
MKMLLSGKTVICFLISRYGASLIAANGGAFVLLGK